jgi:hypothetical protein
MLYKKRNMTFIETVLVISGAIGALITTGCWNIRRSRCEIIESLCLKCSRKLMTDEELKSDILNRN